MEKKKEYKTEVLIEDIEAGPLKVTGNFIFKDLKKGEEFSPGEILLCRCGKSSNKPYCDGSHEKK